jgi:hypothetical protein
MAVEPVHKIIPLFDHFAVPVMGDSGPVSEPITAVPSTLLAAMGLTHNQSTSGSCSNAIKIGRAFQTTLRGHAGGPSGNSISTRKTSPDLRRFHPIEVARPRQTSGGSFVVIVMSLICHYRDRTI